MNKIKSFLRSDKAKKILALSMIFVVLSTVFVIPSFAAEEYIIYQTISPIYFNNFSTYSAYAGFVDSSIQLASYTDGVGSVDRSYLNNGDYYNNNSLRLFSKTVNGEEVLYFTISLRCQYSAVYVNSVVYDQAQASTTNHATLNNAFEFICYPVESSYTGGAYKTFVFDVALTQSDSLAQAREEGYDQGYAVGYQSGFAFGTSSSAIESARQQGYNEGYSAGRLSTDSENLGQNLLGDTLSAPMDALNQFVIYKSSSGFEVTLGLVVGGAISLTLFIAFLKIFAGG